MEADSCFRICYRYLRNTEDAEDALIKGFTKIFESIINFEYTSNIKFKAWLKKIMINESLMILRKRRSFIFSEIEESMSAITIDFTPLDGEVLYEAITYLPETLRTIFNLYVIEGFSHKEISEQLNISPETSSSQLSRARKQLREILKSYDF